MERRFRGYGLLKRLSKRAVRATAAVLVVALTAAFCPKAAPAGGLKERAAMWLDIKANELLILPMVKPILQEATKMGIYETLLVVEDILHNYFIDVTYKADNKPLAVGDVVSKDQALQSFYTYLNITPSTFIPTGFLPVPIPNGGELSFGALFGLAPGLVLKDDFDAQDPGYRDLGSAVIFSDEYKKRTEGFLDFAYIAFRANNFEAFNFLKVSDDATNPPTPKMIKKLHDVSLAAGNPLNIFSDGDKSGGYRQVMHAGNQIVNFTNQELARLRVDMSRLAEERERVVRNERQEKIDIHAAFDQAVKAWTGMTASGTGY
jgi:hypothetical protein